MNYVSRSRFVVYAFYALFLFSYLLNKNTTLNRVLCMIYE